MKYYLSISILLISFLIAGCGEGTTDISDAPYTPKLVIDAYIYPDTKVEGIRITRNFPLNQNVNVTNILITDAVVIIKDVEANKDYRLSYNPLKVSYEYDGNDLIIHDGKTYRIDITASIDGSQLHASSETTVPTKGLELTQKDLGSMFYREKDASGNIKKFIMKVKPSPDASAVIFSYDALDADIDSFIYNNAYLNFDSADVEKDFSSFQYSYSFRQGTEPGTAFIEEPVEWLNTWFYGRYRVVVYAADKNFHHFLLTHKSVMEPDGNFHEPRMYITGDGIGVFGSAIADTLYFTVKRH